MANEKTTLCIRIDPKLKKAFQDSCDSRFEDMSSVLTRAIVEYVRNTPPPLKFKK